MFTSVWCEALRTTGLHLAPFEQELHLAPFENIAEEFLENLGLLPAFPLILCGPFHSLSFFRFSVGLVVTFFLLTMTWLVLCFSCSAGLFLVLLHFFAPRYFSPPVNLLEISDPIVSLKNCLFFILKVFSPHTHSSWSHS